MYKTVIIQRQPIPGAQVGPDDKVGIGISFGMTAKGEVFITGACGAGAPNHGERERGDGTQVLTISEPTHRQYLVSGLRSR